MIYATYILLSNKEFYNIMKLKNLLLAIPILISTLHCSIANAGLIDYLDDLSAKGKVAGYEQVSDKEMVAAFYSLSEDGKTEGLVKEITGVSTYKFHKLSPDILTITRPYYKTETMQEISNLMNGFSETPMDDVIGQRYVEVAKHRGNEVKQYRPAMTLALNKMFIQNFRWKPDAKIKDFLGSENSLIEYSKDGKIISIMTRSQQALQGYGAQSWQYINIIFGPVYGNVVQNKLSNSFFADTFMRNLIGKEVPVVQ